MANYIAVVHKETDSDYGVSFPDFPGCVTAGSTIDEAIEMANEALSFHVRGMIEDGEPLPKPTEFEHVSSTCRDAVLFFAVSISEAHGESKIAIEIDDNVLNRIDQAARRKGMSRSAFFVRSALSIIEGDGEYQRIH